MLCTHCRNEVKPVVCLDIDGTMGNYHGHFLKFFVGWAGLPDDKVAFNYRGDVPLNVHLGVSLETYRTAKLAFRQGGMKRTMPAMPGAASLARMVRKNGAELWITTTRPYLRLDNIDPDTREWLRRNEIDYDYIFYDEHKYSRLLEMVDKDRIVAILDDEMDQVIEAQDLGLPAIYRRSPYNSSVPLTVAPTLRWCWSLAEAKDIIYPLIYQWRNKHDG